MIDFKCACVGCSEHQGQCRNDRSEEYTVCRRCKKAINSYFECFDGDENACMLAELLQQGIVEIGPNDQDGRYPGLYVNISSIFSYGVFDTEDLYLSDIETLYESVKLDRRNGVKNWICAKRKQQPIGEKHGRL